MFDLSSRTAASGLSIGNQAAQFQQPRMGLKEGETPTLVEPDPGFRFSRPVEFPGDPSEVHRVAMLGGSTGATLVEDARGNRFVRKEGNHPDHIREEVLADQIYRLAGVPVPEPHLYETPRGPVKLSPFISDATTLSRLHDRVFTDDASDSLFERARQALKQHFVL